MDAAGVMDRYYRIQDSNGIYYEFHNTELAPPQGNFAKNYVRFCHNESNATKYCFAWTTSQQNDVHEGGEFFIADYAIQVQLSSDTMVVWRGKDYHGTTLPHYDPKWLDRDFHQVGLSIAISGRIRKLFEQMGKQDSEKGKCDEMEKSFKEITMESSDSDGICSSLDV